MYQPESSTAPQTQTQTVRRARPLLGTFVEIALEGCHETTAGRAFTAGFSAIEKVQSLMSAHDPASDIGRFNNARLGEPVRVHRWTWYVIRVALSLANESDGAFDPTVAADLSMYGYLPRVGPMLHTERRAKWDDILLLPGRLLSARRPARLDLGGIAKGFALDRAVAALQAAGAKSGLVNAGGDLRAFGPKAWPVQVRHPADPARAALALELRDAALCTSSPYFSRKTWRGREVSALLQSPARTPYLSAASATVLAPTAILADALSKPALLAPDACEKLLTRHRAYAFLLDAEGRCRALSSNVAP